MKNAQDKDKIFKKKKKKYTKDKEVIIKREEVEASCQLSKSQLKKIKCYFYYEKIKGIQLRDYRNQLQKEIIRRYNGVKIKDIPEKTTIHLKFKVSYNVFFDNQEYLTENIDNELVFDKKMFTWVKGIEENEYGVFEEQFKSSKGVKQYGFQNQLFYL